jgi:hypothetical protein
MGKVAARVLRYYLLIRRRSILNFNIVVARRNTELSLETFKNNITLLDMGECWTKK